MKILLSHDIDHMTVWEHLFKDLILPKFVVRSNLELLKGKISVAEYLHRIGDFFKNKWQGIEEVMNFHDEMGIKSTFFIGVNNGVGLSYKLKHVEHWVPEIARRGFEVGVHGIAYNDFEAMKKEFETFKKITPDPEFGIRMHYLRNSANTLDYIKKAGYLYDATIHSFEDPYRRDGLWIFPLQIMDGWAINGNKRFQSRTLAQAKEYTLREIEKARTAGLEYFSILFHDRYMSPGFLTWKKWYEWLVPHLKSEGCEFMTHKQALAELKSAEQAKDLK